jgi:hypothetical protein
MSLLRRRLVSLVLPCEVWGSVGVHAKAPPVYTQGISPELLYGQWSARWIAPPTGYTTVGHYVTDWSRH